MEYVYAALLLHKAGKEINESSVQAVLSAAGIAVNESRVKALVAALDGVNIEEASDGDYFLINGYSTINNIFSHVGQETSNKSS